MADGVSLIPSRVNLAALKIRASRPVQRSSGVSMNSSGGKGREGKEREGEGRAGQGRAGQGRGLSSGGCRIPNP
jgi:hypothetical protein